MVIGNNEHTCVLSLLELPIIFHVRIIICYDRKTLASSVRCLHAICVVELPASDVCKGAKYRIEETRRIPPF